MDYRNNRGITGVDISVALVIVVLFVGLIATIAYNFSVTSQGINRKSEAINIAIQKVEELKNTAYSDLQSGTNTEYKDKDGQTVSNGAYRITTEITRYVDSSYVSNLTAEEKSKISDIIKIVKVTVNYTVNGQEKDVQLSTVITKGD
ncbi:MAG: hypothetical protein IKF83_01215 [Clostridia bacterium]|nr:hypothetical protein [Clostridia bacterium]